MSTDRLKNKKIAILATDGFEQSELEKPLDSLKSMGATVEVISLEPGEITGWDGDDWGNTVKVDVTLNDADAGAYDALVLPGGLINPDTLRNTPDAVDFIKQFSTVSEHTPIAAVCHGPWLLIEAGLVKGVTLTSFPSIKTDLKNAGANWVDQKVVTDKRFITSRNPDDLPDFIEQIAKALA